MPVFRIGQKHMIALSAWKSRGRVTPPLVFSFHSVFCLEDLVSRCTTKAVFCLVMVLTLPGGPMAAAIPPGGAGKRA